MTYRVVFQKDGRDIGTLYWNGALEETQRLARQIATKGDADAFRVSDFTDVEVCSEKRPFRNQIRLAGTQPGHLRDI